jgi:hypothetical protein
MAGAWDCPAAKEWDKAVGGLPKPEVFLGSSLVQ